MALKKADDPVVDVERFAVNTTHSREVVVSLNDDAYRLSADQAHNLRRQLQAAIIEVGI